MCKIIRYVYLVLGLRIKNVVFLIVLPKIFGLLTHMYLQRPKRWTELNWPQVYKPALEMLTVLLQSRKHLFLDEVITFMGIHEEHIIACIMDIHHSLDKWTLDLAVTALTLIRELSQFKDMWRLAHEKSMFTIVVSCLNLHELWRFLCIYSTVIYPCLYNHYDNYDIV
jgi:hypothetical protein